MSNIEWTEKTWNPVTGCTKVSAGCRNCYAEGVANRFWGDRPFSAVQFHPERLEIPLKRKKPTTWFVNSMSDLFHPDVTDEQIDQVFAVMALTPQHTYQVLTKRPDRMFEYFQSKEWDGVTYGGIPLSKLARIIDGLPIPGETTIRCHFPLPNVWLGVSVEDQKAADERIPLLLQTPAAVRFLSCEPLLEKVDLTKVKSWHPVHGPDGMDCLQGGSWGHEFVKLLAGNPNSLGFCNHSDSPVINWVIVGGESGAKARPCDINWIRSIVQQCQSADVPVFVKQLGTLPVTDTDTNYPVPYHRATGKGGNPDEWPEDLRVRQMPKVGELAKQ